MTVGAAVASLAALLPLTSVAQAATPSVPPTIKSAFTPTEVGVGDTTATALSVTITNPNATGTLSGVSFTDTLPTGLSVDDPNGENGSCGSASVVTANPGSQTISLAAGSLKGKASCTVSVSVVASQTGVLQNKTGPVSSSAGPNTTGSTASVTVLPPPTVSVTGVKNNAKYAYGKVVRPHFTCAQAGDPTALSDCSATDDLGNDIASGGALKTKTAGRHSLLVTATSTDGLSTTDTINYTVQPNNKFTVTGVKHGSGGVLNLRVGLPGAGKVKVVELAGKSVVGSHTATVHGKRTLRLAIKPSSATPPAKVTLQVTYTPKGGVKRTVTKRGVAV